MTAGRNPVFVAIDTPDLARAQAAVRTLRGAVGGIKLGLEFFAANGPAGVRAVMDGVADLPLFLDLKLHDIPNTVAGAVAAAAALKPRFLTVHAAGGPAMLRAAAQAAAAGGAGRPRLLGVTVLTSLGADDLERIGFAGRPLADHVAALARLARDSGLDGVVCSPQEVAALRRALGPDFVLMVPGVRPPWAGSDDQKRVMTPADAMRAGATHLVIGRPILAAADPAAAARRIAAELGGGPPAA